MMADDMDPDKGRPGNAGRLGMDRPIRRRDFLNGVAVAGAGLAASSLPLEASALGMAAQDRHDYYPPTLTGMRGSHPGSFEVAHSLRDGTFWQNAPPPAPGETSYDLVVVGGGISGLAAAHFYREAKPDARILILDNHDDFGGHAKRNEATLHGRTELINGGTLEIDSPRPYSAVADGLLRSLGVYPKTLAATCAKPHYYDSVKLGRGIFFDRETFGADRLATGVGARPWRAVLRGTPLSERAQADIARIYEARTDYLPGLTSTEKKQRLSAMSYVDFLSKVAHVDPSAIPYFQAMSLDEWGVGCDAVSALDVWTFDFPGFQGLALDPGPGGRMGNTAEGYASGGSYVFHFPDGNASIARLLVRRLVPAAVPGHGVDDLVTSRVDYAALDRPGQPVRIRLSSVAVGVRNLGDPASSRGVEIVYARGGALFRLHARDCVLACYNMVIPYLCPELPGPQKDALHSLVKIPLVYTTVELSNWRAFQSLGVHEIYAPGSYHTTVRLNPVVDVGSYRSVRSPNEPVLLRMVKVPCMPGLDERTQHRAGRAELLGTSFDTFELKIRDQLGRMLGPAGFDPARDITGITVNRWPHGYAYEYNVLFDPVWAPGQAPHELGRARFGRISIANSDSGAAAYTDSAIDQAWRAVQERLTT